MNKPMILVASSMVTSLALLHLPSVAQDGGGLLPPGGDTNNAVLDPNPLIEFSISDDILKASILEDPIEQGVYRKPDAYEAELADFATRAARADRADRADLATEALHAVNADLAVRVEEKLPYGQAWDFGITQAQEGSRTYTQHYARPSIYADSVLINAHCITAGEKGDLSRVTVSFDTGFTRSISLCQSGRTSGTEEHSRDYNAVNLAVPQGATSLSITQYIAKRNNGGTAMTDGFVQWFGPHSQVANATAPTDGTDNSTTPEPDTTTPPTTGGGGRPVGYHCTSNGRGQRDECYITGDVELCVDISSGNMEICDGSHEEDDEHTFIWGNDDCEQYEWLTDSPDCITGGPAPDQPQDSGNTDNCLVFGTGYCAPPEGPADIGNDDNIKWDGSIDCPLPGFWQSLEDCEAALQEQSTNQSPPTTGGNTGGSISLDDCYIDPALKDPREIQHWHETYC